MKKEKENEATSESNENAKEGITEKSISFDLAKAKKFISKYGFLLLLLVPIIMSMYIRLQPTHLDVADTWARNSIYSMIQQNLRSQVDAAYPNLPEANKQEIVDEKFQEIIKRGTINIQGQDYSIETIIAENSKHLKEHFQDENGKTYLLGLDEYYWYRLAGDVIDHGFVGDIEKDGKYYDSLIVAGEPLSAKEISNKKVNNFHIWVMATSFKIINGIDPSVTLMQVAFIIPAFVATLAVIPAFFIGRRIAGDVSGFIAACIVALNPTFLMRTIAGTPDTDAYVIMFPLMVLWLAIEAIEAKQIWKTIALAAISGFVLGLFAFTWTGWFFVMEVIVGCAAVFVAYKALLYFLVEKPNFKDFLSNGLWNEPLKRHYIGLGIFIIASFIFISIFTTPSTFTSFISNSFQFTKLKEVATTTVWPNVLTTVAELNPSGLESTIDTISYGSSFLVLIALCGFVTSLFSRKKTSPNLPLYWIVLSSLIYYTFILIITENISSVIVYSALISLPVVAIVIYMLVKKEELEIRYTLIILVWFIASIYASTKGVRFVMFVVPPFALAVGATCSWVYETIRRVGISEIQLDKYLISIVAFLVVTSVLVLPPANMVEHAYRMASNQVPLINDVWFEALTKIKNESKPDAVINSWWDFGHWFAAIADRPVTLDGGRQSRPQAHWLGKLMITSSEDESVGILRMLDCGGNTAFDKLMNYFNNDPVKAINTEYTILSIHEKEKAREVLLENRLSEEEAEDVLSSTHCTPPENFFITSEDMVGKSGVWAHFGSWNLTRSSMYFEVHNKNKDEGVKILTEKFGLNSSLAEQYYNEISIQNADVWVSPWPSYASGLSGCSLQNRVVQCSDGVVYDIDKEKVYIKTQIGNKNPKHAAIIDKHGEFKVITYNTDLLVAQNGRELGVAIIPDPGNPQAFYSIFMDADLVPSMFTRLFYFYGHGLSYFKEFYRGRDLTGADIIVWKIDWEGKEKNVVYKNQPAYENGTQQEKNIDFLTDDFAKCLDKKGAKMYGASWCSHCQNQKKLLNNSKYIPYIECDGDGADECADANITAYPTWIINGEKMEGELSIPELSELTGCKIRRIKSSQ